MSYSTSQALTKRSRDTELMPPPRLVKRIKRPSKVLDEDVYAESLARIIARDFFPSIEESKSQLGLMDALESRDREWIEDAGRRLSYAMTPQNRRTTRSMNTPSRVQHTPIKREDTPFSRISEAGETSLGSEDDPVDINMSLDAFVAKYTSEDNESFYKLIDRVNEKKASKYLWLRAGDNKIAAPRQIAYRERQQKLLENRSRETIENNGQELLKLENIDNRPAMPDTWKSKPNNQLMYLPDSVEDEVETIQQRAEANSRAPNKSVTYSNTRLPPPEPTIPTSPTLSAVQDAIAGRPRRTASESSLVGSETPRVNGYSFVDDEASPEPEDTPSLHPLLARADMTPSPFKLGDVSNRERLRDKLVDKITKSKRRPETRGRMSASPVPRFPSSPNIKANLSPAGRMLLTRIGTPKAREKGSFDTEKGGKRAESGLKFGWTPTPGAKGKAVN